MSAPSRPLRDQRCVPCVYRREFLAQTAHVHRQSQYNLLLDSMSARLKADAALVWAKASLLKVPYFTSAAIEDEFLASCALTLKSRVFCRQEYVPLDNLIVIERGIAAKEGRISTKGSCLGVDMVLNSATFRNLSPAIALTFVVQVASLEKKSLEALVADYPLARREVRRGSFRIAFSRAVIQVAKLIARNREIGVHTSIPEAFIGLRRAKQRQQFEETQFREPTRKLLANNLLDLSERTEEIARDSEGAREALSRQLNALQTNVDSRARAVDAKLDSVLGALAHIQPLLATLPGVLPLVSALQPPLHSAMSAGDAATATPERGDERGDERSELRLERGGSAQAMKAKAPSVRHLGRRKKTRAHGFHHDHSRSHPSPDGHSGDGGGGGGAPGSDAAGNTNSELSC